jgi:hypothetical protein
MKKSLISLVMSEVEISAKLNACSEGKSNGIPG